MYLGIDVGGTKTLIATFTNDGHVSEETKFPTPKNYDHFLLELRNALTHFKHKDFKAAGVGIPVSVFDREHGIGVSFGNLPWKKVPIEHDIQKIVNCPIVVENDAKMAAFSEAFYLQGVHSRVLYVTVSTGIGVGLVVNGEIDKNIGDAGGKSMMIEHRGKRVSWEEFSSGKAIVRRYGKLAEEIHNEHTWQLICRDLAKGLIELIAIIQPEAIVMGGSVGNFFERYGKLLRQELKKYEMPLVRMPKLMKAKFPNQAVIYGCYLLAHQEFGVREKVYKQLWTNS